MRWIASVGGVGFLRPAPGTWGSLAALPMAYGIHQIGGFWFLLNLTVFVSITGYQWKHMGPGRRRLPRDYCCRSSSTVRIKWKSDIRKIF